MSMRAGSCPGNKLYSIFVVFLEIEVKRAIDLMTVGAVERCILFAEFVQSCGIELTYNLFQMLITLW
jgi:hypothetical protein